MRESWSLATAGPGSPLAADPAQGGPARLLSVGASLGAITLVFQNGAFGLSMDYEVFLLARMHEEWERGHGAARAIARGMATTGRH